MTYKRKRRGLSLDATGAGPYIKLGAAALLLIAAVLAVVFVIVPAVSGRLDLSGLFAQRAEAEPAATPELPALLTESAQTFALDSKRGEAVLVDPYITDNTLVYASGASEADCDRLVVYDLSRRKRTSYTPVRENDCLRMPRLYGSRLVYFDAKSDGGGSVCLFDPSTEESQILLTLDTGVPRLFTGAQYLLLRTLTSEGAAKLYAFDLSTYEAITLALLSDPVCAVSDPGLGDGTASYAVPSETETGTADIVSVNLQDGTRTTLETGLSVHDVKRLGDFLIFLSAGHGSDTDLYVCEGDAAPVRIAEGVIDAGLCDSCAVYGRDGTVYAYAFFNKKTYMISGAEEYAELIAAGGGYALWRVLADGEPVWHYLKVN